MSRGQVLSFLRYPSSSDWTQQELAEFYRVEDVLLQGGFAITTDRGVSDEGDPWFVVCRADSEEVIAHFARIDRQYVIVSNFYPEAARGYDFHALVHKMLNSHQLMLPVRRNQGQKVLLHPATLLVALLASAYVISSEKEPSAEGHHKSTSIASLLIEKFSVFAAAILAATWLDTHADATVKAFENWPLFDLSHDHKATVAVAHEVASFDIISPNSQSTDVGAHGADHQVIGLSTKAEDAGGQGDAPLKAINCVASTHNASENTGDAITPPPDHGNDDQASATGTHSDCINVGILTNLQIPLPAPSVAAIAASSAALSQASAGGSLGNSSDSAVVTTDAFHLTASEISTFSTPTVLLSTEPVPVDVALQQAFNQVGLGNPFAHVAGSSAGAATSQPAATEVIAQAPAPVTPVSTPIVGSVVAAPSAQAVEQVVAQFLESTPSAEVTLSGANVVIIDTNTADAKSPGYGLLTFDMSDGSTVSLVGILPSHLHALAA